MNLTDLFSPLQKVTLARKLIDEPFDLKSVAEFLQNLHHITWLDCHQTELGTEFYEHYLPSFASLRESLVVLHLNESTHDLTYSELNFSFLKAFRQLRNFSTNLCPWRKAAEIWCEFDHWPVRLLFHYDGNMLELATFSALQKCCGLYRMEIYDSDNKPKLKSVPEKRRRNELLKQLERRSSDFVHPFEPVRRTRGSRLSDPKIRQKYECYCKAKCTSS